MVCLKKKIALLGTSKRKGPAPFEQKIKTLLLEIMHLSSNRPTQKNGRKKLPIDSPLKKAKTTG